MIGAWMVYGGLAAALLAGAGLALERVWLQRGGPARWIWMGTLLASLLALAAPLLRPAAGAGAGGDGPFGGGLPAGGSIGARLPEASSAALLWLDRLLALGWALGSLGVLGALAGSALALRRRRRRWREGVLSGSRVRVSRATGPAVIGFLRPEIVVPEWVLGWDAEAQRLLVAHEREHLRAGDPYLLLGALLALAAVPWNPALWWQVKRLRLAVELDCDARVLRDRGARRRYGLLLLEVGGRGRGGTLLAPGFSQPSSWLERRIRVLAGAQPTLRPALRRSLSALAALAALLVLTLPTPERPRLDRLLPARSAPGGPGSAEARLAASGTARRPELLNRHEAPSILQRVYPPRLLEAGIGGTPVVSVLVDPTGRVRDSRIEESAGHPELDEAARRAVRQLRFAPARAGGSAIAAWVQLPVSFIPSPREPAAAAAGGEPARLAIWRTAAPLAVAMR